MLIKIDVLKLPNNIYLDKPNIKLSPTLVFQSGLDCYFLNI